MSNRWPFDVPGITSWVEDNRGYSRPRRACEYPNHDYSDCENGVQKIMELENKVAHLMTANSNLEKRNRRLKQQLKTQEQTHKNNLQVEIDRATQLAENRLEVALRTIKLQVKGGHILYKIIDTYGGHIPSCNYIDLLSSGRLVDVSEEETCSCDWIETKKKIDESKEKGENTPLTSEQILALLDN